VGAYLDVSMTDVMSTWTGRAGPSTDADPVPDPQPIPGYGLFTTADDRQVSLGVVNEQHFWARLCRGIGLEDQADLDFETRRRRGTELQELVTSAIARRPRDELVAALVEAGVPVAPVLQRGEMIAAAPFPPFPIRLGRPERPGTVPSLDQHQGQGFHA
jgi:crotonobetainyl-CoA:carnitine CoA-transferase CaiB-like acyl-CoA transferase